MLKIGAKKIKELALMIALWPLLMTAGLLAGFYDRE